MAQESWKCDQDETGCQPPEGPILCTNNCGFFGSKATMNLCSKCYRDVVLSQAKASTAKNALEQLPLLINNEQQQVAASVGPPSAEGEALPPEVVTPDVNLSVDSSGTSTLVSAASSQEASGSRPPNRCSACNKRVGLTGFNCRCGNVFCSLHRYSDKHNCTFDYKSVGRDAIAKANPVVKADKIDKI